jgi:hypothetical protein
MAVGMTACSGGKGAAIVKDGSVSGFTPVTKGDTAAVHAVSFDAIGGADVMPIGGYYGPFSDAASYKGQALPEWISDGIYEKLAGSGVNLVVMSLDQWTPNIAGIRKSLELSKKYNMGYFVDNSIVHSAITADQITPAVTARIKETVDELKSYPAFVGLHLYDEPSAKVFGPLGKAVEALNGLGVGDLQTYTNLHPNYATSNNLSGVSGQGLTYREYVEAYCVTVKPKFISYDHYPYKTDGADHSVQFFENLSIIRAAAKTNEIPFWAFAQAGGQWNDAAKEVESVPYYPAESEMLWTINMALSYGAKGIQYFPLLEPAHFAYALNGGMDFYRNGLLGAAGNLNEWYFYAQKANKQIQACARVLMNADNLGVIAVGGDAERYILAGAGEEVIASKSFRELQSVEGDAVVGCFDYKGGAAFYVSNLSKSEKKAVKLNFDATRGCEVTQRAEKVTVAAKTLTLTLEAGEGALVVLK